MRACGCCGVNTVAHVLIANHGVCNDCAEKQDKARQKIIQKDYLEYVRSVRKEIKWI
jgi:hypothetical protein